MQFLCSFLLQNTNTYARKPLKFNENSLFFLQKKENHNKFMTVITKTKYSFQKTTITTFTFCEIATAATRTREET